MAGAAMIRLGVFVQQKLVIGGLAAGASHDRTELKRTGEKKEKGKEKRKEKRKKRERKEERKEERRKKEEDEKVERMKRKRKK